MRTKIEELESKTFFEEVSSEIPPGDIVAYNELRSCADLYRMYTQGILKIQPEFQREIVWKGPDQSRFIDSLIKQLPIPSLCFSYDPEKQEWMVIDGLQRISTIVKFLSGGDWKISKLDDIDQKIAGKSVAAIKVSDSKLYKYYSRVENLSIPVTVLRCDHSKKSHLEYLFTIFHRLNTGGMKLNNQEIRNCIYGGPFNRLLKELDLTTSWRKINKMRSNNSYRFTKQELILRFFAFHYSLDKYDGNLAKFLNSFMYENRYINEDSTFHLTKLFQNTSDLIFEKLFDKKSPKKNVSITIIESLMVGVCANIVVLQNQPPQTIKQKFKKMLNDPNFSDDSLKEGLSRKQKLVDRLNAAIEIFSAKTS
ncbi:hypothetical protein CSA37_01400 [Candidatus Fermentibacteria bacterium]|nr:MAG: hypothetical protein CSA37_01400 [Candidatus Fermentibacteria bacterium]